MKIVLFDVDSVKQDLSIVHIIESHKQVDKGTLSTSWLTDESDTFSRIYTDG